MTIEIHQPELETLIHQQMASGRFQSEEDVLLAALGLSSNAGEVPARGNSLEDMFSKVRGLADDLDTGRP